MIDDALIVRTSPFHDRSSLHCVTNSWTNIAGTTFVSVYRNVEQEYWALRNGAGLIDTSWHYALRISGDEALEAVDYLTTGAMGDLAPGSFMHTLWCTDEGHVIGDGLVLCEDAHHYLLVTRAPCLAYIADVCAAFVCTVDTARDLEAGLELIGPSAAEILEAAGLSWAPALHPGSFVAMTIRGLTVRVARRDNAGVPAYTIWAPADSALLLWDRLRRAGSALGLMAAGIAAHTIARLEAGEAAYALDYVGALVAPSWRLAATPQALGLEKFVDLTKPAFNGKAALRDLAPARRKLVTLAVEGSGTLAPAFVTANGLPAGHVTSAGWSPRLGCGLVMAWVDTENASLANGLRVVSPVRGALSELGESNRDGRPCRPYTPL